MPSFGQSTRIGPGRDHAGRGFGGGDFGGGARERRFGGGAIDRVPTRQAPISQKQDSMMSLAQKLADAIQSGASIRTDQLDESINTLMGETGYTNQTRTAQGLDEAIQSIISGETFGSLYDERMRGAQDMLSAGGLTRSGEAIRTGAEIPTDLALQLENIIYGRDQDYYDKMVGIEGLRNNRADIEASGGIDSAAALVEAALAKMQKRAQDKSSNNDLTGNILSAGVKLFGGL